MSNIYIYQTSPNQKTIITKKAVSDADHIYGIFNISATLAAARSLSDRAFKLYCRMNLHRDGHTYALSPAEIEQSAGLSDKRYREAVKELIEKGFLVQDEKRKNLYAFYEHPEIGINVAEKTVLSSGEAGYMSRQSREHNPAKSEGERIHNITSDTTEENTRNNNWVEENDGELPF